MSTRADWVWGRLPSELLAHAEAVAARMLQNVKDFGLPQIRISHTPDERYQKLLGAEGELAFRHLTGRPIPTVDEMVSTWKSADVDGLAVKTIGKPGYRLLFDDSDLVPAKALVLVLNAKPDFAIVGRIDVGPALAARTWGAHLPRPAWVIEQRSLEKWYEDGVEPLQQGALWE